VSADVALAALAFSIAAVLAGALAAAALRWSSARHENRLSRLSRVELAELFLFVDSRQFVRYNAVAVVVLPSLAGWVGGLPAALVVLVVVLVAPMAVYRWLRGRRRRALLRQLPDVAAALASSLRAGLSLSQALEQVVKFQPRPSSQEFSLMLREHRLGVPLDRAARARRPVGYA
jgi:tight adherence protein B